MPEIKNQFTGGKMNKDLDERLIPKGQYRDAMNIQVATSEGSDVGTAQNILGNEEVKVLVPHPQYPNSFTAAFPMPGSARVVGSISDEKIDTMYYLVYTKDADYILSWKSGDVSPRFVFIDQNKDVLKFSNKIITGINVIDGMLFWTDNINEPRKINIQRCIKGTSGISQTELVNNSTGFVTEMEEKHITVIKKGPQVAPDIRLHTSREPFKIYSAIFDVASSSSPVPSSFTTDSAIQTNFSSISTSEGSNEFTVKIYKGLNNLGEEVDLFASTLAGGPLQGLTGWYAPGSNYPPSLINKKVVLQAYNEGGVPPGLPLTDFVMKGHITGVSPGNPLQGSPAASLSPLTQADFDNQPLSTASYTNFYALRIKVTSVDGFPPLPEPGNNLKYVIDAFEENEGLFEFKFPRFSYRYKFEDGEYSTFAPFTQVAFAPGSFDYHPRKGYNIGMTNKLSEIELLNMITAETPDDVVAIDILFKDDSSPSIYVVDTIKPDDYSQDPIGQPNLWNLMKKSSEDATIPTASFVIKKETISSIVPSNQLLRPWDSVPIKALAQDVTGNRIVYANYVQNYDLLSGTGEKYVSNLSVSLGSFKNNINTLNSPSTSSNTYKSVKSLREYQLGVVFLDKYGRETPVLSNTNATHKIEKLDASSANRLTVQFTSDDYPESLTHFKFYVKETSSEYYNMAMDRWYSAGDGNIWLAFPSTDRNKIDVDTFLILKKGSDQDDLVSEAARYKVLAIESEAPDFIKTIKRLVSSTNHSSGSPQTEIFDPFGLEIPFQGETNFQMRYKPFHGTSGQNLSESQDELWIEFGKLGSDELSDRYRIVSITNDWDGEVSTSGFNYSVQLDRQLEDDVNFISDDISGANPSIIDDGAVVNIYRYKVENLDKFDGRFFVKIYGDEVFTDNIDTTLVGGGIRTSESRKIYSMNSNNTEFLTNNLDRFATSGKGDTKIGWMGNQTKFSASGGHGITGGSPQDWMMENVGKLGYYRVDEFTANALYFRKYRVKNYAFSDGIGVTPGGPKYKQYDHDVWEDYTSSSSPGLNTPNNEDASNYLNADGYRVLVHLQNGSKSSTNRDTTSTSPVEYHNQYYKDADNWWLEFGYHSHEDSLCSRHVGQTSDAEPRSDKDKGVTTNWKLMVGASYRSSTKTNVLYKWCEEDPDGYESDKEQVRDNEVWFIDNGPRAGYSTEYATGALGYGTNAKSISFGQGLVSYPGNGSWQVELGFGGIKEADKESLTSGYLTEPKVDGFWNVGNWNNINALLANNNYVDETGFINRLNLGFKFRWREDPDAQIYVQGNVTPGNRLRHSHGGKLVRPDADKQAGSSPYTFDTADKGYGRWSTPSGYPGSGFKNALNDVQGDDLNSMAEKLSFNHTKNFVVKDIVPAIGWDPTTVGEIPGGMTIALEAVDKNGGGGGPVALVDGQFIYQDLKIYVKSLTIPATANVPSKTLHKGMALKKYTGSGSGVFPISGIPGGNDYFVVRHINKKVNGIITYYELLLGGYLAPLTTTEHAYIHANTPLAGAENYTFVQVGMNGHSPNSEFNINTIGRNHPDNNFHTGAIGAVGYHLEMVDDIQPLEILSENPAIFETEPKSSTDLDIYYEGSGSIPINVDENTVQDALPIGTRFGSASRVFEVVGYEDEAIIVMENDEDGDGNITNTTPVPSQAEFDFIRPDDLVIKIKLVSAADNGTLNNTIKWKIEIEGLMIKNIFELPWHNCYSFGNGVESNRIRDNYNLPYVSNGVKASTTLEQEYKKEHRKYGLIYSGLYNSTSGINNLNQFIQAEKITKDVNPIYGSIQKLYSRNSDLVALCEDKILKIQANKDAVFNADGNPQLIATNKVLGQTIPFSGEYGISTNPESFAAESFRAYFTDRVRGAVIRMSMDGLTPISDAGMKDYFRDNLRDATELVGSYDDRNKEYNLSIKTVPTYPVRIIGTEAPQNDNL